jgi:tight adherence protein B
MNSVLAALAGSGIGAGIWLIASGLLGRSSPHSEPGGESGGVRPPSRLAELASTPLRPGVRRRSAIAVAVAVVVEVVTRWPTAAVAAGAAAVTFPTLMSTRSTRRQLARLDALESWVRKLAGLLGASQALESALHASARHTSPAIASEMELMTRRLAAGMNTELVLYRLADDLADPVGDLIAGALVQASDARGQGVKDLLEDLAVMVASDVAARREIEASRAPHRATLRGLAVLFALFLALLAVRHDYAVAYDTIVGQLVLGVVLTICGLGLWMLHRLAGAAPVQRFLVNPAQRPGPEAETSNEASYGGNSAARSGAGSRSGGRP